MSRQNTIKEDRDTQPMFQDLDLDEDELSLVEMDGDSSDTARITLELAEVERDAYGIPTFVFMDELKPGEMPQSEKKVLEVVLLWRKAVMTIGHYDRPRRITIGDSLDNDFRIAAEHLPADRFPMVEPDGAGFMVNVTDHMALEVRREDGSIRELKQLQEGGNITKDLTGDKPVYRYRVGLRDRIAIQLDELTFVLQFVSPARWIHAGISKTVDFYFSKVLGVSMLAHLFLVLAMLFTPQLPEGFDNSLFQNQNRFADLILNPPEIKKPNKKFDLDEKMKKIVTKTETVSREKFGKVLEKKVVLAGKQGPRLDIDKREMDRKRAEGEASPECKRQREEATRKDAERKDRRRP